MTMNSLTLFTGMLIKKLLCTNICHFLMFRFPCRILKEKALDDLPLYKSLLEQFTTMELIDQAKLCTLYESELKKGTKDSPATSVFDNSTEGKKRWVDLRNRVVEHNIRILAK